MREDAAYRLTLFARRDSQFNGELAVRLEDTQGKAHASGRITGLTPVWQRFTCTSRSNADDVEDRGTPPLAAVASRLRKSGDIILKVVNTGSTAQSTRVRLTGPERLRPVAQATVLTSARPEDENTLDQPLRVSPATTTVTGIAAEFSHTFPANSLTILRLATRR